MSTTRGVPTTRAGRLMGVLIPAAGVFLVVGFFAAHQMWSTGFFMPGFGVTMAWLFYASLLYTIVLVTASTYRDKNSRTVFVVNLAGAVLWTVTTVWIWIAFPFNYAHLADVVPSPLQFILTWVTPGIGKTMWALLAIGSAAFVPFFILQYATRHRIHHELRT